MCMDFMNLNKVCLKDIFPLPKIAQLVDSTTRHGLLSFVDAFLDYNHVPMFDQDEEHTSFVTNQGLYCYNVVFFSLKNV